MVRPAYPPPPPDNLSSKSSLYNKIVLERQRKQLEKQKWEMIFRAAIHDDNLKDLLNKVEFYWKLKYDQDYSKNESSTESSGPK